MVSVFKRGNKLYLQFTVNGKRKQKSTGLEDTPANRKLLKKEVIPALEAKIISGEIEKPKVKFFKEYADIYLKQKEHIKTYWELQSLVLKHIVPYFGDIKADEITRGDIKEFIANKLLKISPKRAKEYLNAIGAILDIALDFEHIKNNPARGIKLPQHTPVREMKPFTKEEVQILLSNAEGQFQNFLAFAFYTGARHGELIALQWSDINIKEHYISITKRIKNGIIDTPKTKSSIRKIPIFNELLPYIKNQMELAKEAKSLYIFFTPRSKKPYYRSTKMNNKWKKLLKKCGFEYRVMYNTRHTFATNMIKAGVKIFDVSQMLGHKTIEETIKTYAKYLNDEHLKINRNLSIYNAPADNLADIKLANTIIP